MTVRKEDAIRFEGFDEHSIFRGYLCGPYDLGWRLVNAGLSEAWVKPGIALWHFAHPDPPASLSSAFSLHRWLEVRAPHLQYHALAAVEVFSSGRLLPRRENRRIFAQRMSALRIGTDYEKRYATLCGPEGFSAGYWSTRYLVLCLEGIMRMVRPVLHQVTSRVGAALRTLTSSRQQ